MFFGDGAAGAALPSSAWPRAHPPRAMMRPLLDGGVHAPVAPRPWPGQATRMTGVRSPPGEARSAVLPFGDPSRARRLRKVAGWLGGLALAVAAGPLLGGDVTGRLSRPWGTPGAAPGADPPARWGPPTVATTPPRPRP